MIPVLSFDYKQVFFDEEIDIDIENSINIIIWQ